MKTTEFKKPKRFVQISVKLDSGDADTLYALAYNNEPRVTVSKIIKQLVRDFIEKSTLII